jgi:hypothetical protein
MSDPSLDIAEILLSKINISLLFFGIIACRNIIPNIVLCMTMLVSFMKMPLRLHESVQVHKGVW